MRIGGYTHRFVSYNCGGYLEDISIQDAPRSPVCEADSRCRDDDESGEKSAAETSGPTEARRAWQSDPKREQNVVDKSVGRTRGTKTSTQEDRSCPALSKKKYRFHSTRKSIQVARATNSAFRCVSHHLNEVGRAQGRVVKVTISPAGIAPFPTPIPHRALLHWRHYDSLFLEGSLLGSDL